jgi:hypothetical protein
MDRSKPIIISGVDVTGSFTAEDIMAMFHRGTLRDITDRGYCSQGTENGMLQFVPYEESLAFRTDTGRSQTYVSEDFTEAMRQEVERENPILRSTPQEKVARFALRIMAEVKRTGRVTGMSNEEMRSIVGESWKEGQPLTGEDIQKLSQWFMGRAEVDNKEADSHRVTSEHMT